ncbi:MAG: zinc-ribbon domain-containing protein, partial [Pseudomonas sp.]|nr:zinc-ribbon domain-containing protein [Pseudomonas sp.]
MTDSFVTQCPHCQTSFRVSHAQLSVARGVVRCGSCLQVFNAARQLLEQRTGKEAVAPDEPTPVEPPPQRAISQKQWTAAELDLDDLDLDEELARLEQREIQPTKEFGQERKHKEDSLSARRDTTSDEEEQWSDSLFSGSAAERAEAIEPRRTEPSLSFELDDLTDEPMAPPMRLDLEPPAREHHERLSATDDVDEEMLEAEPPRKKHARSEPGVHDDVL